MGFPTVGEREKCEMACPQSQRLVQDAPGGVEGIERRFGLPVFSASHALELGSPPPGVQCSDLCGTRCPLDERRRQQGLEGSG